MTSCNENLFLKWLDKQIAIATTWENSVKPHEISTEADRLRIRAKTLQQVREKYAQLIENHPPKELI
jgi:hypothetical protein